MGLISKTVMVKWNGKTRKYYESLGYSFTRIGDEFEVLVKDLPKCSNVRVNYICDNDNCNKELSGTYNNYNSHLRENGKIYCRECAMKLYGVKNSKETKLKQSKSFYDWCKDNNKEHILDRWDYEKNKCSPKEISYGSSKKYYFKCDKHPEHESELKSVAHFTSGQEVALDCKQCNSIAQYILDNFKNKKLYDVWDKSKNKDLNPWEISCGSNKKVWIMCQEKDYHGSYEIGCGNFTYLSQRCPYCFNQKIHPKDSLGQYIVDNYGEEFLHNIWSNKNELSPFEIPPKSGKSFWWKCSENCHDDYLRSAASSFRFEFRCPSCIKEKKNSVIEEKTKTYLEEKGFHVSTEHECTIRAVNPKTKHYMPYDNEIILTNGKHLIIEVHGKQHYKEGTGFFKGNLKQRQLYDRYKKYIAWKNNYEYLELPYTSFEGKNKDQYKQMIDNKIKEILEKEEIA